MKPRPLGAEGLRVSPVGFGAMVLDGVYGAVDRGDPVDTIRRALDLGMNFLDTSDAYAAGRNEELVGRAMRGRRDEVVLATKFGNILGADGSIQGVNGKPEYVGRACDRSLARLGVEVIDLYYLHRVDGTVPIEDTVGAMAGLVVEGKVRYLGLSEAAPATLRRAHAVHPITALQTEYSLLSREVEDEILPTCRELGVGFVAYSPLGRGFLTGAVRRADQLSASDSRHKYPRFQEENLAANGRIVDQLEQTAAARGCTAAQLALAWLLAQGDDVVPIPGTKTPSFVDANARAVGLALTGEELEALDRAAPRGFVSGQRYHAAGMKKVNI